MIFQHLFFECQYLCYALSHMNEIFYQLVNNIYMEGTVSQISILGSSFYFVTKNGKPFDIFFKNIFNIT